MFQKIFLKIKIWMKFEHTTEGFRNKVFWNDWYMEAYMKIAITGSFDPRTLKASYFYANIDIL